MKNKTDKKTVFDCRDYRNKKTSLFDYLSDMSREQAKRLHVKSDK
jgi:hypothetical protein